MGAASLATGVMAVCARAEVEAKSRAKAKRVRFMSIPRVMRSRRRKAAERSCKEALRLLAVTVLTTAKKLR